MAVASAIHRVPRPCDAGVVDDAEAVAVQYDIARVIIGDGIAGFLVLQDDYCAGLVTHRLKSSTEAAKCRIPPRRDRRSVVQHGCLDEVWRGPQAEPLVQADARGGGFVLGFGGCVVCRYLRVPRIASTRVACRASHLVSMPSIGSWRRRSPDVG
jgi:hypothetical protein